MDLFFFILRKYKAIIAAALVCMCLFVVGGTLKEIYDQNKNYDSLLEEYENEYQAYQQAVRTKEIQIESYQKNLDNLDSLINA